MINLKKISGLPIFLDEKNFDLKFEGDFPFVKKSERTLDELRPYLKNPQAATGPDPVYRVWRSAYLRRDDEKIKSSGLRYDLTLIPPGKIDGLTGQGEFVKTAGHYHKNKPGLDISYPEVYEVLYGRAYLFIQLPGQNVKNIKSAILVEAGPGDKFLIPPSYGHNTINVFDEPLLMANWISESAKYDYDPYKNNNGASYHFVSDGHAYRQAGHLLDITKNPAYESVPEIKKIRTKEMPEFGLSKNRPLYSLVDELSKLRVLNNPEEFQSELTL